MTEGRRFGDCLSSLTTGCAVPFETGRRPYVLSTVGDNRQRSHEPFATIPTKDIRLDLIGGGEC